MNRHVAIGLAVLGVWLVEAVWRSWRRLRHRLPSRIAARLDVPVQELLSECGRFKAVAYAHDDRAFRVEVLSLTQGEADERFWRRVSRPSFVDRAGVADVMADALRAAAGEE